MSVTRKKANGDLIGQTLLGYDAHGRQTSSTDARNGTTSVSYNNADQPTVVTTPAPGTGEGSQTTILDYDSLGRVTSTSLLDGGQVQSSYLPSGELAGTSGTRIYPVGYNYDAQGGQRHCDGGL